MNENVQNPPSNSQNFQITAMNKRENSSNYIHLVVLTFLTVAMMIISAVVLRNFISAVTILFCGVALMLYYVQKPQPVIVQANEANLVVGSEIIKWDKIKAWDIVEGQNLTEVYIITTKITTPNITFYIPKSNFHSYNQFLDIMYANADFQKDLAFENNFQNILRIIGLK
jgi:hypothetical protein